MYCMQMNNLHRICRHQQLGERQSVMRPIECKSLHLFESWIEMGSLQDVMIGIRLLLDTWHLCKAAIKANYNIGHIPL